MKKATSALRCRTLTVATALAIFGCGLERAEAVRPFRLIPPIHHIEPRPYNPPGILRIPNVPKGPFESMNERLLDRGKTPKYELPEILRIPNVPVDPITLPKWPFESRQEWLRDLVKTPKPEEDATPLKVPNTDAANPIDREYIDNLLRKFGATSSVAVRKTLRVEQMLEQSSRTSGGLFDILYVKRVSDPARSSLYSVQSHGSAPKLIDTAQGLVNEANLIGARTAAKSVYIFVDGPSPHKDIRALELSLRNLKRSVQTPLVVAKEPLALAMGSAELGFSTYDLTSAIAGQATLSDLRAAGKTADGYHQGNVHLTTGLGTIEMSIYAKSRAMLDSFYHILRRLFSKPENYEARSILAVIQEARRQLAHEQGKTLAEVDRDIGVNIANSQVAVFFDIDAHPPFVMAIALAP